MRPKRFIALCVALAVLLPAQTALFSSAAAVRAGNENYYSNQGELAPDAFVALPLSSVKAKGFLETQLLLQKAGITGNMALFRNYNEATSSWLNHLNNTGENWEKGMYYLRGLISVACTLEDPEMLAIAKNWVDGMVASAQNYTNGLFGRWGGDWWPYMPALMALRDYYEYTEVKGEPDSRVIPLIENYLRYEAQSLPSNGLSHYWDAERAADNVDSVLWLYNRTYDPADPAATQWLLDLASSLESRTVNWVTRYTNETARYHIVNTTQGLKAPGVYWQLNGRQNYKDAIANGIFNYSLDHGRIDWMVNADEPARDNQSTVGTESCAVVEGILSMAINERIFGEAWMADWIERVAYNALPAMNSLDGTAQVYFNSENQLLASLGDHDYDSDYNSSAAYGAPGGFECCFPNHQMGWGKFIQSMWMATRDNGLAATVYGPTSVTAKVAGGKTAQFDEDTDFPFKDVVRLTYGGDNGAAFPLKLRVPSWAKNPAITVNGKPAADVTAGEYYTVDRVWHRGDIVALTFPSEIKASTWYNNSVGIEKGALVYGLAIDEQWRVLDAAIANQMRNSQGQPALEDFPNWEAFPASPWNYGLVVDYDDPAAGLVFEADDEVPLQPFAATSSPVRIVATGQRMPHWELKGNVAGVQPWITAPDPMLWEEITLIPYGAGRLRVTNFPRVGEYEATVVRTDILPTKHNGVSYTEVDNVVVPTASDYTLHIAGSGTGTILVNGKWSQALDLSSGAASISNMRRKLSGAFQFKENTYNNIRFTDGLAVSRIEVVPVSGVQAPVSILSAARNADGSFRVTTNIKSTIETRYHVKYGTAPGVYTMDEGNFDAPTATIVGTDPSATYYIRAWAYVNGAYTESSEYILLPYDSSDNLRPNPNAAAANYELDANAPNDWTAIAGNTDPAQQPIVITGGVSPSIRFEDGLPLSTMQNRKAYLNKAESDNWTDYVAEIEISMDDLLRNNAGLVFRGSGFGDGADAFNGYYAGIGYGGVTIGYGDGGWHQIGSRYPMGLQAGETYAIKAVAYGDQFAIYVDEVLIAKVTDSRYAAGTIGVRSYEEAFTVTGVTVRPVTEADLDVFEELSADAGDSQTVTSLISVNAGTEYPKPGASFTHPQVGSVAALNNGKLSESLRWTCWTEPIRDVEEWVEIDFGQEVEANRANLVVYTDTGASQPPASVEIRYFDGEAFVPVSGQTALSPAPAAGSNAYDFDTVTTSILRAYMTPQSGKAITLQEFEVYHVYEVATEKPEPREGQPDASYAGFGTEADIAAAWDNHSPPTITVSAGGGDAAAIVEFAANNHEKFVLKSSTQTASDPLTWTDYVAEAKIMSPDFANNDAGLMIRATGVVGGAAPHEEPDGYHGYYIGLGSANNSAQQLGVCFGYANGAWNALKVIPWNLRGGQAYTLKVVAYGHIIAAFVDGVYAGSIDTDALPAAARFAAGTVGLRSYNTAFTAYDVKVRNLEQSDLAFLTDADAGLGGDAAGFYDNFSGGALTGWTLYPANNGITVSGGALSAPSGTQVKAVAGSESWEDYVVEGNVRIPDAGNSNNAGFMVRATGIGDGPDAYRGFYFGITHNSWIVGYADGSWHQLATGTTGVQSQPRWNRLKIVAMGSVLYYYINGALVHQLSATGSYSFSNGCIGIRSYTRTFFADEVAVRPISEQDVAETNRAPAWGDMTVDLVTTSANVVRVLYTQAGASEYRIAWGARPGEYMHAAANLHTNGTNKDATAFEVSATGVWYAKVYALSGSRILAASPEFAVTTGETAPTSDMAAKLAAAVSAAESYDTGGYTAASAAYLEKALAYAGEVAGDPASNRMVLSTARQLLKAGVYGATRDPDYGAVRVYIEKEDGAAAFYIVNSSDGAEEAAARLIVAAYDANGRMTSVTSAEAAVPAGSALYEGGLSVSAPSGGSARAFIWGGDTLAPLCDAEQFPA
ncbi:MAG: glycoside hydrolase family 127 protein [Oscillospiraceae bacterium]|jgi:hypothetical protein|nr:glycoside hydrolase family 127 protein [Oscillospiraceae bacterium]